MTLLTILTFLFLAVSCIEMLIIVRFNQLLESRDQYYFLIENERDTLRDRILKLQHENEYLEEALQKTKEKKETSKTTTKRTYNKKKKEE